MTCLEMIRSLEGPLPEYTVPEGYSIINANEDNGHLWEQVMDATWDRHLPGTFRRILVANNGYEEGCVFVLLNEKGSAIATSSAWDTKKGDWYDDISSAAVAFVGVLPSCNGHGFGKLMTLYSLHEIKKRGYTQAHLSIKGTDDGGENYPAVKTYLNSGFVPYIPDKEHKEAWQKVYTHLGISLPAFACKDKSKPHIDMPHPPRPWPYQVRCAAEALAAGDTYIFGKWDRHNLYLVDPDRYIQLKPLLKQSDAYEDIVKWILKKRVKAVYIDRPRSPQALLVMLKSKKHIRIGVSDDERFERGVEAYLKA